MIHQGTKEWKEQRVGKFTASTFGDCMGTGRVSNRAFTLPGYRLIQEKVAEKLTGEQKEITGKALDWGTEHEDEAVELYKKTTGENVEEAAFCPLAGYEDDAGGSPDGLVMETPTLVKGIIEVKCPWDSANHIETLETGTIPAKYRVKYLTQMQFNMWATGTDFCDFVSYDPRMKSDGHKIVVERILRDEEYIAKIKEKLDRAIFEAKGQLAMIEIRTKSGRTQT